MGRLILVRHGVTDWNKISKWQGLTDIPINDEGKKQARLAAQALKNIRIDKAYTSKLSRTIQTYHQICDVLELSCPTSAEPAFNERDYGEYTGENKWEVHRQIGDEEFLKLRRGWSYPIPRGETLKDVYHRVVPFFEEKVLPDLKVGQNILVVSSGNTLRALIKYLEKIKVDDLTELELGFGEVKVYDFGPDGEVKSKKILYPGVIFHPAIDQARQPYD